MKAKITNALLPKLRPSSAPYEIYDTELKGFTLRIQPSGAMTYLVRYRLNRKQTRKSIGRTTVFKPAEAREEARRILASVTMGENPSANNSQDGTQTLVGFLDNEYRGWVIVNRRDGKATVARLETCFSSFLNRPLSEIKTVDVDRWRTKRLKNGTKASTINRDVTSLKALLAKAVEWGVITDHPLAQLKPLKIQDDNRVRFLERNEEIRLREALIKREEAIRAKRATANAWRQKRGYPLLPDLDACQYIDHLRPMTLLSLNTGLRRGEIFSLRWTDVDFPRAFLTVQATNAKSGQTRHVSLNDEALDVFRKWKTTTAQNSDLVFPGPDGKPMTNVKNSWKAVLDAAKITDFRWHDLRHHFASRLVMAGVDLNTVRELLGHADIKMTLRYAHLAPEHKAAAVAKLSPPT